MNTVKLTYFKKSGKYYAEGEYQTVHNWVDDMCDEIRAMPKHPGLSGRWSQDIHVYSDSPSYYPCIIHMEDSK